MKNLFKKLYPLFLGFLIGVCSIIAIYHLNDLCIYFIGAIISILILIILLRRFKVEIHYDWSKYDGKDSFEPTIHYKYKFL
jgi:hypothetical protein